MEKIVVTREIMKLANKVGLTLILRQGRLHTLCLYMVDNSSTQEARKVKLTIIVSILFTHLSCHFSLNLRCNYELFIFVLL